MHLGTFQLCTRKGNLIKLFLLAPCVPRIIVIGSSNLKQYSQTFFSPTYILLVGQEIEIILGNCAKAANEAKYRRV